MSPRFAVMRLEAWSAADVLGVVARLGFYFDYGAEGWTYQSRSGSVERRFWDFCTAMVILKQLSSRHPEEGTNPRLALVRIPCHEANDYAYQD